MSEDIQKTMEIRKAVAPMIQTMVREAIDPLTYLIQPIAKQTALQVLAKTDEIFEETRNLIKESHENALGEKDTILRNLSVIEKSMRESNLELTKYLDDTFKAINTIVDKFIEKIDQEVSKKPEVQKVIGSVEVGNIDKLETKIDDLSKTFQKAIAEDAEQRKKERDYQREFDEVHGFPVRILDQAIASVGGGGARNTDERVWLRERYTYTTVSGQTVPSRVEKWNESYKLTENFEYDANANPVIKSRSLEPSDSIGT